MRNSPLVSVIIPLYNGGKYIGEALRSILNQSYSELEVIIINDGSVDNSAEIVQSVKDSRITLLHNNCNQGLAYSLNRGIKVAKGTYIVRMDADDVALPKRVSYQVNFMEQNPNIGVSGSWMKSFGESNYIKKYPSSPEECRIQLLFDVPIGHPSAIMRKNLLISNNLFYNEELKTYGEDYDLWYRVSKKSEIANIPKVLMLYRTFKVIDKKEVQAKRISQANAIRATMLSDWIEDDNIDYNAHKALSMPLLSFDQNETNIYKIEAWVNTLIEYNREKKTFDEYLFYQMVAQKFFLVCYHHPEHVVRKVFKRSGFSNLKIPLNLRFKYFVKALMH